MSHPDRERWMDYIYQEADAAERRELEDHLATCAECERRVAGWRQTMDMLEECVEQEPVRPGRTIRLGTIARWAMAATILVLVGYVAGRVTTRDEDGLAAVRADLAHVRAELRDQVLEQAREEMDDKALATLAACRSMTEEMLAELAVSFDATRRNDMWTLAALTERELVRTQRQIAALAYERAAGAAGDVTSVSGTLSGGGGS
jgi:anti-sigma factor RsiW